MVLSLSILIRQDAFAQALGLHKQRSRIHLRPINASPTNATVTPFAAGLRCGGITPGALPRPAWCNIPNWPQGGPRPDGNMNGQQRPAHARQEGRTEEDLVVERSLFQKWQ